MSIFQVNETTFIDIRFGGAELPGQQDLFDELVIIENVSQLVPTMSFKLNDSTNYLMKRFHVADGLKVEIKITQNLDDEEDLKAFRIFGGSTVRNFSEGHFNEFNCILDVPKYVGKVAKFGMHGSTSDVIKRIARDCNLTFNGESTNDYQSWLGSGITYSQFAKKLATHGYISDKSCMLVAVNEKKELLYKDIIKELVDGKPKASFTSSLEVKDGEFVIYGNMSKTSSGFLNNWMNYGYIARVDGVTKNGELLEKVEVSKREDVLAQNLEVKSQVETARIDMLPFNCGNTYEKFEQAFYQNLRLKSTFTESMSLIVYDFTDVNILDTVQVNIGYGVNPEDLTPSIKSGNYLVIGKTKIIRGGINYGERLELIRNSTRHEGINALAS